MKSKVSRRGALLAILVFALSASMLAQVPKSLQLGGTINDYTPSNTTPVGPWEVRGTWSMYINSSSIASFTAELNMIRSDYWVTQNPADVDDPSTRTPHTHHIRLTKATITAITGGFEVTGTATVLGNGGAPPFGTSVPIVVDITGGANLTYSNIKLTFLSPADVHFGSEPVEGIVRQASHWNH